MGKPERLALLRSQDTAGRLQVMTATESPPGMSVDTAGWEGSGEGGQAGPGGRGRVVRAGPQALLLLCPNSTSSLPFPRSLAALPSSFCWAFMSDMFRAPVCLGAKWVYAAIRPYLQELRAKQCL